MKIGILLPDLGATQEAFMAISYINTLIHNKIYDDFTLFYCTQKACVTKPLCAAMTADKVYQFDGLIITTNLYTTSLIKTSKNKKCLYLYDLEWLRNKGNYFSNNEILNDPNLILMCRSIFHAQAIKNYCGRDAIVVENFNLKQIVDIVKK